MAEELHRGLLVQIAREFTNSPELIPDLLQEGQLALIHAKTLYNPAFGVKFTSYAAWWIRDYMRKFLVKSHRESTTVVATEHTRLEEYLGKWSNPEFEYSCLELAGKARDFSQELLSRDREIFEEKFLGEMTSAEMARAFNVSRERMRQIETRLRVRFRSSLEESRPNQLRPDVTGNRKASL